MKRRRFVNTVASTTFGVLLIHANSDAMRQWLWRDLLDLPSLYAVPSGRLVLCYIAVMFGVFAVCSMIDLVRIRLLETPLFNWINRHEAGIEEWARRWKRRGAGAVRRLSVGKQR